MKLIQFEPLFIRDFKTSKWPFPLHNHNHFELMYIHQGKGVHILNGKKTIYLAETIFFLQPEDKHDFIIEKETHFSVIKFLPNVLKGGINASNTDFWDNLLSNILRKLQFQNEKPIDPVYIHKMKALIDVMVSEWKENNEEVTEIHTNLLRSVLLIVDKALRFSVDNDMGSFGDTTIDRIQNYIHAYICYPDKLTVKELSTTFKMSQSGFRLLFRKKMGIPLRNYISSLKLQLIKERIKNSSNTLSEISQDFGFTDSSHLYRFFIKNTGMSPLTYRKKK